MATRKIAHYRAQPRGKTGLPASAGFGEGKTEIAFSENLSVTGDIKMPDGSIFARQIDKSYRSPFHSTFDPVKAGYLTANEWSSWKQHSQIRGRRTKGAASYAALRAQAILHTASNSLADDSWLTVRRGSVRYWHLIALFERDWIEARRDKNLQPHEKAALALFKRGVDLSQSKAPFYKVSRFRLVLAQSNICRDQQTVEWIKAVPYEERRRLLVQARQESKVALRRFFAAVERYRRLRREYEDQKTVNAADLSDIAQFLSLEVPRLAKRPN